MALPGSAQDPMEGDFRKLFRACYGAAFAVMVLDHMREGRGAPTKEDYDRFAEEAATIGVESAKRMEATA